MANVLYPLWKQELLKGNANSSLNAAEGTTGVFAVLIDTGTYTFNKTHQFYSSLTGIVGTEQEILTKTQVADTAGGAGVFTGNGAVFDGTDLTFPSVTGATAEAIVIFRKNAGANTTWQLVAYIDTGVTNLPVTPNGGNITITWNASGILGL